MKSGKLIKDLIDNKFILFNNYCCFFVGLVHLANMPIRNFFINFHKRLINQMTANITAKNNANTSKEFRCRKFMSAAGDFM